MSVWVSAAWMDAEIVRWAERPGLFANGAAPLSPHKAASYVDAWFGDYDQHKARGLILELGGDLDQYTSIYQVRERIREALISGSLVAYPIGTKHLPTPDGGGPTYSPIAPQPTPTTSKPPKVPNTITPTRFEVRWVDEIGDPIPDIEVVFFISGSRHKAKTDRDGVARYTDPGGSGFAWVEPSNLDALRRVVAPRWDAIRGDAVLTDGDTHVVVLRESIEPLALVAGELETLSVQPYVERVRLLGEHFESSKSFLLPAGLAGAGAILNNRTRLETSCLHIVGHTDTSGREDYNEELSLERADSLRDYLTQNIDGWLAWYEDRVASEKRWGHKEDLLMIDAMHDHASRPMTEPAIRWYQRTRGLTEDNVAGPITRAKLIGEYMTLSGKPLRKSVAVTIHGCGESFPREATGDDIANSDNRRVETYFFARELGVQPPALGAISTAGSPEYPEWVKRSRRTDDHITQIEQQSLKLRLHDLKRTPMPFAHATAIIQGRPSSHVADSDGFIYIILPTTCPTTIQVSWGPESPAEPFSFIANIIPNCNIGDTATQDRYRLHNLGYIECNLETSARLFQMDYGVDLDADGQPCGLQDGELPEASRLRILQIYNEMEADASTS